MSDHDHFGEPTAPLPAQPLGGASRSPVGPSFQPGPPLRPPPGQPGQPGPGGQPGQPGQPLQPGQQHQQPTQRRGVPGWLLPVVAVVALLLGVLGGVVGGALTGSLDGASPISGRGVFSVQQRDAAPLPADNTSIPNVAAKVLPSTVQIVAEYQGSDQGATGSGWVLDRQGHIVTNNHVVDSAVKDKGPIQIVDSNGRRYPATVVGRSTVYDLAVLKADPAKSLAPIPLGSSRQMHVGETVVAFGSPLGLSSSVTSGIISALNRPVTTGEGGEDSFINAVQTDAAINPGNSGGPLVDLQGQVVGVNSAIASLGSQVGSDQGGNIGVGFAIPVEQVQTTAEEILRTGKAVYPVIGAGVKGTAQMDGATIDSVTPGMPAAKAGLKVGDIVRRVDGRPITSSSDLVVGVRSHVPGDKVTLTVERDGKTQDVQVGLEAKTG